MIIFSSCIFLGNDTDNTLTSSRGPDCPLSRCGDAPDCEYYVHNGHSHESYPGDMVDVGVVLVENVHSKLCDLRDGKIGGERTNND